MKTDEYAARMAADMTENALQAAVLNFARQLGWMSYHTHDSRRSQPGFPDLVLVRGHRVLWRELKTQTGRLRPDQTRWITALELAGQDAAVWRPIDWFNDHISDELQARA